MVEALEQLINEFAVGKELWFHDSVFLELDKKGRKNVNEIWKRTSVTRHWRCVSKFGLSGTGNKCEVR
jgi:hypothetical protein